MIRSREKLRVFFGAGAGLLLLVIAGAATPTSTNPGASKSQLTHETVVVTALDRAKRSVTLQTPEGETKQVSVPEDLKVYDSLKVGDKIDIDYYESIQLTMLPAGTKPSMSQTTTGGRMGEGKGGGAARETQFSTEITAIDTKNNKVTLKGPQGKSKTVAVQDPEVQKKLQSMKVGDVVQLTYTEAVAASIRQVSKLKP
jgi:Cu/Ag efflux protein CusF